MPRTLRKSLGIFWICLRFDKFCFILWCLCALESEMLLNFPESWLLRRKLCGWMYVFLWYCLCWNTASNPNVCVLMQCWKKKWLAVRSVTSCRCCYHSTARLATLLKVVGPYLLRADRHLQSIHVAGFSFLRKKIAHTKSACESMEEGRKWWSNRLSTTDRESTEFVLVS